MRGRGKLLFWRGWRGKDGLYLVQDVDMVVLRGEGGVAVTQPVHHGAAGDDDGRKQGADAVFEGWKLQKGREKVRTEDLFELATGSQLKRKREQR